MSRPGRPRVDPRDQSVTLCLTLPARQYDRACHDARRADVSVAEVIRRQLAAAKSQATEEDE